MGLPVVFRGAARPEFAEAADWYMQRRAGLGAAFAVAAERVLGQNLD